MKFTRFHDVDLANITMTPRHDLEVDDSFIAFDVKGFDTFGIDSYEPTRFTMYKYINNTIFLKIKCKAWATIKTYGTCTEEESEFMDKIYHCA